LSVVFPAVEMACRSRRGIQSLSAPPLGANAIPVHLREHGVPGEQAERVLSSD